MRITIGDLGNDIIEKLTKYIPGLFTEGFNIIEVWDGKNASGKECAKVKRIKSIDITDALKKAIDKEKLIALIRKDDLTIYGDEIEPPDFYGILAQDIIDNIQSLIKTKEARDGVDRKNVVEND